MGSVFGKMRTQFAAKGITSSSMPIIDKLIFGNKTKPTTAPSSPGSSFASSVFGRKRKPVTTTAPAVADTTQRKLEAANRRTGVNL